MRGAAALPRRPASSISVWSVSAHAASIDLFTDRLLCTADHAIGDLTRPLAGFADAFASAIHQLVTTGAHQLRLAPRRRRREAYRHPERNGRGADSKRCIAKGVIEAVFHAMRPHPGPASDIVRHLPC